MGGLLRRAADARLIRRRREGRGDRGRVEQARPLPRQRVLAIAPWLLISGAVHDVTNYLRVHPGGAETITPWCGKEATEAFATEDGRGEHSPRAQQLLASYYIGELR
jgi:hypothetical protein